MIAAHISVVLYLHVRIITIVIICKYNNSKNKNLLLQVYTHTKRLDQI